MAMPKDEKSTSSRPPVRDDFYRLLVQGVRDYAVFAQDVHGYVLTWNGGAEHIKRYKADEIIGKHFSIFYPPDDIARGKPEFELKVAVAEGRMRTKDGASGMTGRDSGRT
jgi:PAS domain S-box-containing protein